MKFSVKSDCMTYVLDVIHLWHWNWKHLNSEIKTCGSMFSHVPFLLWDLYDVTNLTHARWRSDDCHNRDQYAICTVKFFCLLTKQLIVSVLFYTLDFTYCSLWSFSKMAKLEELEEVDLSGNMLKTVPTTIMNCRRMHTLIAHSNAIEVFPEVMQLMEMKVSQWQ